MSKVSIVMGSDSDLSIMSQAAKVLEEFGVEYEMKIISAHRMPDIFVDYAKTAKDRGVDIIIAGAGGAAHLPGMCAALFPLPVIGVPLSGSVLDGMDALMSIVQMPSGIPVATVAINGSKNAAYLALQIMAIKHESIKEKLLDERKNMEKAAMEANEEVISKYQN